MWPDDDVSRVGRVFAVRAGDVLLSKGYARGGVGRRFGSKGVTAYPFRGSYRRPPLRGYAAVARKLVRL